MTPEKLVRVVEKMLRRGDSDLAALLVAQQVEDDLEAAEAVGDYLERRAALRVDDGFIGWFHHFYRRQVFNACLQDALREIDPTVAPETKTINAIAVGAGRPDDRWAEAALRLCGMTEPEFNVWIAEQWQHVRAITATWSVPTLRTGSRPPADRN